MNGGIPLYRPSQLPIHIYAPVTAKRLYTYKVIAIKLHKFIMPSFVYLTSGRRQRLKAYDSEDDNYVIYISKFYKRLLSYYMIKTVEKQLMR